MKVLCFVSEMNHMSRNQIIAVVVMVVVVASVGVAFIFMSQPTRPPEDTLIWEGLAGVCCGMDPHVNYGAIGDWILYNVYETLYTYPWDSAVTSPSVPLLAASAPLLSADGLNYTITLRTGIKFTDGSPFNASCVKWNFERAMKIFYYNGPAWMIAEPIKGGAAVEAAANDYGPFSAEFKIAFDNWVANSSSIIVIDENTIRFVLTKPYAGFIAAMTYEIGAIMSPTYAIAHASDVAWATWNAYGVNYGEYKNYMANHTCGTGPYTLTNWVLAHLGTEYIELTQNAGYWRTSTSTGAGSIEKVILRSNEDPNARSLNLRAGTIDVCQLGTTEANDIYDNVTHTSKDPNIHVSTGGTSYNMLFFGYNMGMFNTSAGVITTSPYANKNFRKCSSYAFDYTTFITNAVYGLGIQAHGPIPYGMFGCNATSYKETYNITKAVEYWNLAMQDPVFVESLNNITDTMTIYYPFRSRPWEQGSLILADGLTAVVNDPSADLTGLDKKPTFVAQVLEYDDYRDHVRNRQMHIFFASHSPEYADPDIYVYLLVYHLGSYASKIGFNNSVVNTNYLLARAESDPATRMHYYNIINDVCADEFPYLYLYQRTEFRVWRTWLHGDGLVYNPMHESYWFHMYKDYTTV